MSASGLGAVLTIIGGLIEAGRSYFRGDSSQDLGAPLGESEAEKARREAEEARRAQKNG